MGGKQFARLRLAGTTCLIAIAALILTSNAFSATIASTGPLTNITISTDLNCAVNHTGDFAGEWYGDTACITGAVDLTANVGYTPAFIPAGGAASGPSAHFTPVSQVGPTGSGTSADPYKIVTVVDLGLSGLHITQTDSYVVGQESYRTDVQISNTGGPKSVRLYAAGDCYLQNSDYGFGRVDGSAITCTADATPTSRIEQLFPLTAGSSYMEAFYNTIWSQIGSKTQMPNTCECAIYEDNGIALSWDVSVPAGGAVTVSHLTTFSPLGFAPLTTTKTADSASTSPGGPDGYTITIHNPNATGVTVNSITDTLPAGFSYVANSTTGATTANPSISSQTLTWSGSFGVVPGGDVTLHFLVTASSTPGTYYNNAGGDAGAVTVAPTGDTAPITVLAPAATSVTTSLAGGGQSGASITVPSGTAVNDSATLSGTNASSAGGTVTYTVYSNNTCTTVAGNGGTKTVANGTVPNSDPVTLTTPGTYYWVASYSGDPSNAASASGCGAETETVTAVSTATSLTTSLSGGGKSGAAITVPSGTAVNDSATLSGTNASSAGGTVTYTVYSNNTCTTVAGNGGTKPVTNGSVPDSDPVTLTAAGTYYWVASYSGDPSNAASASGCGAETETVTAADTTKPSCTLTAVGTDSSGKKYAEATVRDQGSGLATILVTKSVNATTVVPPFAPGTTSPVVVRSTKINQSLSSTFELTVTDVAGNRTICDPVLTSVIRSIGDDQPASQTFSGLPQAESRVTIMNGDPGMKKVKIVVNGVTFKETALAAGEVRSFDVASAMKAGNTNTIVITGYGGKQGATADIVISD